MDKEIKLVTQVTLESGKVYFLYSDGNLYTREDEKLIKLDNIQETIIQIILKIISNQQNQKKKKSLVDFLFLLFLECLVQA